MRFQKGIYYPHPPRGPAKHKYRMSDAALAQRRRNLRIARERRRLWRGYSESQVIRQLIRQWAFDPPPKPSERALARTLEVRPSYVHKVQREALSAGADVQCERRINFDDLAKARRVTSKLREHEPALFAPELRSYSENASTPPWVSPEEQAEGRRRADVNSALERLEKRRATEAKSKKKT